MNLVASGSARLRITGTQVNIGPAGSAATPALSKTGDEDTGFFYDTADQLAVGCGGVEVARFAESGAAAQVGFLGATPVARPTVTGSAGGNAALQNLLTELENLGLITDSTT